MNKVFLIGRLTQDPELRFTPSGKAVTRFTLAVNRNFKDSNGEKKADFISIVVWGKLADNVANYLIKGRQAAVSGRIETRSYEDSNRQRRYVTEVVADEVQFLGGGKAENKPTGALEENDFTPVDMSEVDIPF
ncbi:single-stranded DNA-binding protein A [Oxobacter pfennigii]|uniref:Single-stranded DNA-binding protein n=1 Tax=Oxobacter pfennigii TaxID=36849 RepID=A0A0P8WVA5_9CLOT|nr:single-stranded DNA-binding protein [Oxobacter pfennigii]KPU42180.1 single-stranded DNA-binding protein A [Oxobacter pfennigii]